MAENEVEVRLPANIEPGVWANAATVKRSDHELTIDFVRLDYGAEPLTGVIVARVNTSPKLVEQLISILKSSLKEGG